MSTPPEARPGPAPVLLACAHGTRNPDGGAVMQAVREAIRAARPGLEVERAYLDVQAPALADVVPYLASQGRRVVVVPLLLSAGYHVYVDVRAAVESAHGMAVGTPPLGPDPVLAEIVQDRLSEAGVSSSASVVLAAAGSSDPRAVGDVEKVAGHLAELRGTAVSTGYLSAASPRVDDAVALARVVGGGPVAIGTYLLAPGVFASKLASMGADQVSGTMAPDARLVRIALARYDSAMAAAGW